MITMTVKKISMSPHAREDRIDRLVAITTTIGFGEELLSVVDPIRTNNSIEYLTSTGVLLVKDKDDGTLITAYMANMKQATRIYKLRGYDRMPPKCMQSSSATSRSMRFYWKSKGREILPFNLKKKY